MKKLLYAAMAISAFVGCSEKEDLPETAKIEFETPEILLNVGEQHTLVFTVTPESLGTPEFSSSDNEVATVENGVVTAVGKGNATITASLNNGKTTASCTVKVSEIAVSDISLDKNATTLAPGATEQLTATVSPDNATDKKVIWSSDKPEIATVSETGLVTAVSAGTATVTATCGSASASCTVTVESDKKKYSIGDLYDENGVKGVVFYVSADGTSGKIVSLDESGAILWAKSSHDSMNTGAKSETDGKGNTEKLSDIGISNFPAAQWCTDHGNGWYMPAISEGQAWFKLKSTLNPTITANGGQAIDDYYWSSTEGLEDETVALTYYSSSSSESGVTSWGDWKSDPEGDTFVRAIYEF